MYVLQFLFYVRFPCWSCDRYGAFVPEVLLREFYQSYRIEFVIKNFTYNFNL